MMGRNPLDMLERLPGDAQKQAYKKLTNKLIDGEAGDILTGLIAAKEISMLEAVDELHAEMGVDHIFPLRGRPPQSLTSPGDQPNMHDSAVTLRMQMRQDWELDRYDDPEEQVRINFQAAFDEIERDDSGTITTPSDEYESGSSTVDQT